MVAQEPKNEQALCHAVIRLLAGRIGESVTSARQVDTVVRNRPAVEWVYETPSRKFAVEHTRIETFTNQISEGKRFAQLLEPLEGDLAGKLPGAFFLIVDVGLAKAPAGQQAAVRQALAKWILETGGTLDPDETTRNGNCETTATPPGVPFEVTLRRDCDYESRLFIMQNAVGDRRVLRRQRIGEALLRKGPKLAAAKAEGSVSVLILESDDIALANRVVVAEAAVAELTACDSPPDIVIWARTSTRPWKCSFIKDGPTYPDIASAKLLVLET